MKKSLLLLSFLLVSAAGVRAQLANWTNINVTDFPVNVSGQIHGFCRITQMKFHHSDPNKFYAITAEGGLFITSDAGENWTVANGTESLISSCASVCVDRTNDQVIYLGTGDPNYYNNGSGVYKSTDGGATFTATSLINCLVIEIIQHPTDANTFVAATNKGIYKTTNNGSSWTAVTSTSLPFCDLKQNAAANSLILYACTNENAPKFYRSTDYGSTWTQITSGIVAPTIDVKSGSRIAVTPADPNVVYFSEVGGAGMIFKSTDSGLNFTLKKDQGAPYLTYYDNDVSSSGQGNYNNTLYVDRNDPSKVWMQSQNTWFSSDDGATWTMMSKWSTIIHTDHHYLVQSPYDASKMYSCNDGGVWLSTDGAASWTPKSNGLYAYEVATDAGKSSHTDPWIVSIGTQDNGRLFRNSERWYTTLGGDDYDRREFDYLPNGGYIYFLDDIVRTKAPNDGTAGYGLPSGFTSVQAMAFNKSSTELGFFGQQDVYRTSNLSAATPTWTQISTINKTIKAMHSCIANPDRLYVITSDQTIYVCNNATAATPVFTAYSLPSSSSTTASITAICNNADIVYIAINNKVYRSSNGGQNWTDITSGLPNVTHRRILSEEIGGTEELVFVATNNAVYYRKATPGTWTNYSTNLPSRRSPKDFSMFDDGTNRSRIRYASYGRAVFETDFNNLRAPQVSFTADHTNDLCLTNGVVKFTDLSTGGPTAWSWSFPGGTPSTSTDQNPTVTYSTPGTYSVTLTITTGSGPFTSTQTNYITVPTINNTGGTYTVGTGGDFATLTAAANFWNSNCINAPVVFNLISSNYPSETFPITFNANGSQSSLLIKPTGNATITGSSSSALIVINGADRITIDGSSGNTTNSVCPPVAATRNLTLTQTNTGTNTAVIWVQSNGSDGASNNTVKNCVLVGQSNSTTLLGVGCGSSAIGTVSLGIDNDNNSFINNSIQKTQYGIYSGGQSVYNKNKGTIINQNLMNSTAPNNILRAGIVTRYEDNILISGNYISNTNVQNSTGTMGIACGGEVNGTYSYGGYEVSGATITYNVIDNLVRGQSFGGAIGIFVASVSSTTGSGPTIIANNTITRLSAPTAVAGYYVAGIIVGGGRHSNTKVYYNSVNLTGAQSSVNPTFGAIVGGSENTAIVDFRDNIIVNQSTGSTLNYVYGLGFGAPYVRVTSNYNDLYTSSSPFAVVGGMANTPAGDLSNFAAWTSTTGKDANSKNVLPEFISASNAHLNTSGTNNLANLIGKGTPLSITTDIDCETRYSNPDIGADENCVNPDIPTLSASANPICAGGSTTLSIATGNLNKAAEWRWYTGSCGGTLAGIGASITVSPATTTTYYVRGEGNCVTGGSCASITVVVNMPAPAISGPTSVCSGGNVTLDAGSGYNTYAWSNSGGSSQTAMFSNITATTTYSVTVTDAIGCVGTDTHTVTANSNPSPTISGPTSVCSGGNVTLDAGSGYSTYAWSNSGGSSQTATFSGITSTTTYSVTVTDANNCSGTDEHVVTVLSAPTPAISGPTSVCSGGDVTLDAGSGFSTYAWSNSGGSSQTAMFSNITATTTYSVTVTDANNCSGSDTHTVTVSPNLTPTITGPTSVCSGGNVTLDAGSGYSTYAWSNSGGSSQTATFSGITSMTTYSVTVTDANNCSGSDTHTVTVNASPTPAISGPTSVCSGGNVTLDAGSGFNTYAWSNSGGSSQTATFSGITSTTTYSVTVTDANNCSGSDTHTVSVNANPTPTISGPTSVCSGGNVTLDAGSGYSTYAWSNSGGSGQTAMFSNITATTTYSVTVTDANNCSGSDTHLVNVGCGVEITGKAIWEADDVSGINEVSFTLSGDASDTDITGTSGNYTLNGNSGSTFTVTPKKNKPMPGAINGLSTADASRIQQHITGGFPFTDPYKMIAADVNKNNAITSFDASQVIQAVLGNPVVQAYFANNTWRFVPAAYSFPNPSSPWGFPESITLSGSASGQDFIGCKLGDVNNTANPANTPSTVAPELVWLVQNQNLTEGDELIAEFRCSGFDELLGLQFALKFDTQKLQFVEVQTINGSPMQTAQFGLYQLASGEIRAALPLTETLSMPEGTPVFRLHFKVLQSGGTLGEAIHLDNAALAGEAYTADYTTGPVNLIFENQTTTAVGDQQSARLELLQNKPNPFHDQVVVPFSLPGSCTAQIRVIDANGRTVAEYKGWFKEGYNEQQFDLENNAGEGVFYYELVTPYGTLARKMVRIKF